jgi:hypothetical protein
LADRARYNTEVRERQSTFRRIRFHRREPAEGASEQAQELPRSPTRPHTSDARTTSQIEVEELTRRAPSPDVPANTRRNLGPDEERQLRYYASQVWTRDSSPERFPDTAEEPRADDEAPHHFEEPVATFRARVRQHVVDEVPSDRHNGTQLSTAVPISALLQMRSRSVQQRESSKGHLKGTTEDRMAGQQPLVKGTPAQPNGDSHSQDDHTRRSQDTSRRRQKLGKIRDSDLRGRMVRQQLG